jgi:hypothetical protein
MTQISLPQELERVRDVARRAIVPIKPTSSVSQPLPIFCLRQSEPMPAAISRPTISSIFCLSIYSASRTWGDSRSWIGDILRRNIDEVLLAKTTFGFCT